MQLKLGKYYLYESGFNHYPTLYDTFVDVILPIGAIGLITFMMISKGFGG